MKWGQRFDNDEEVPEELKGKTPAEVAAALKAVTDLQAQLTAEKTAREASDKRLADQSTEFNDIKTKLGNLEASLAPPPPVLPEPASPWTEPEKFVNEQTLRTQNIALASGMMSAKMYFANQLSPRDQKIHKKYEKEVEATLLTFQPPECRVMPQSWFNAFTFIKGQHEQDIAKAESSSSDFFSERPSGGPAPEPEIQDKLTADEEETCRIFKYDPVKYLAQRKARSTMQGEKGSYSRYPVATNDRSRA